MKGTICLALLLLAPALQGQQEETSEARAHRIIKTMEDLYRGASSRARLTMRVETPHYQRTLTMESWSIGEEKALIRILSPKKERGITTLKQDKEMWNYFPKINKVIKVPPSMMMSSWMGSDFTNDDLVKESSLVDDYRLSLEEDDIHYLVTLTPREQTVTVWGKIEYTVNKEKLLPVKQVFYDEKGEQIRIMSFTSPRDFSGNLLPSVLEMVPLNKQGHKTVVIYEELEFNPPEVNESLFTLRNLKRRF